MENPNPNPKNKDQDPHFQLETPNPQKDQENLPQIKPQEPDQEKQEPDQEKEPEPEEKEAELQQAGMVSAPPSPQNTGTHITIADSEPDPDLQSPPLTSPTSRRRGYARKKKPVPAKRKQALAKKLQSLSKIFKPIPFSPNRNVDFSSHEKLLKRLGLWDFVHIELDRDIRTDLLMQFLVSYEPKMKSGYVNDTRVQLTRADLARAMKLPQKKGKMNMVEVEGEEEVVSDEAKAFVESLVSNWVLLHDDMWILPNEVVNWTKAIREGHPEKVDWASLMWHMVEKEVSQGHNLSNCYYASHLQRVLKLQRETVFSTEPVADTSLEGDDDIAEIKVSERCDVIEVINKRSPLEIVDTFREEVEMGGSDDVSIVDEKVKMEARGDLKMVSSDDVSIVKNEVEIEPHDLDLNMGGSDNVNIGKDDVKLGLDIADMKIGEDDLKMRLGIANMEMVGRNDVCIVKDEVKMEPHGGDVKMGNVKICEDDVKTGLDVADVNISEDDVKMGECVANMNIDGNDLEMQVGAADMNIDVNDFKMQVDVADVNIFSSADVKIGSSDDVNVGSSADVNIGGSADVNVGGSDDLNIDSSDGVKIGGSDDVIVGLSNDVKIGDADAKTGLDGGDVKIGDDDINMGLDEGELKIAGSDDGDNVKFAGYDVNMGTNDGDDVNDGDIDLVLGTRGVDLTVEEEDCDMPIGNNDDLTENQFAEPNVELNLGQNNFMKELVQDDSVDFEQCEVQEEHQWFLNNNNNNMSGPILQPCSQSRHAVCDDGEKQQEDEEEDDDQVLGFSLLPKYPNADDISSENILEEMDGHSLMGQFASRTEAIPSMSGPSGFGNISKREIDHDHDQGNHKRQRMDEQWDDDKLPEPDRCMEIAQQWIAKSRLSYQRQEEAHRNTEAHQEYLMNEIHQRDMVIEHLNKVRFEEQQRKQIETYRLERELFSMAELLQSYRKAIKETKRSFAEYRSLHQYPEQPLYKDVEGGGGLVVTCAELERERVKREKEQEKWDAIVAMIKQFELEFTGKLELYSNETDLINNDLLEVAKNVQILKELRSMRGSC